MLDFNIDRIVGPECVGCGRINDNYTCSTYPFPATWFRNGKHCPMANHISLPKTAATKARVGQQKQKKVR